MFDKTSYAVIQKITNLSAVEMSMRLHLLWLVIVNLVNNTERPSTVSLGVLTISHPSDRFTISIH